MKTLKNLLFDGFNLLIFPTLIVAGFMSAQKFFPGFGNEIAVIIFATIVTIFWSFDLEGNSDRTGKRRSGLRHMLIIATATVLTQKLLMTANLDKNYFGTLGFIIGIGMSLITTALVFIAKEFATWNNDGGYDYYDGLNRIISFILIIATACGVYINFGTNFVWPAVINLIMVIAIFSQTTMIRRFVENKSDSVDTVFILSIIFSLVIATTSTIIQYWFYEIAPGFKLYYLFSIIGIIVVLFVVSFITKKFKKRQAKKRKKAEDARIDADKKASEKLKADNEAEERRAENLKKLELAKKSIAKESEVKWSDILFVSYYYNENTHKFLEILPKIHQAPLAQLVEISTSKRKIVFHGSSFQVALQIINKSAETSNDDTILEGFINQLSEFLMLIKKYSSFEGYRRVLKEVTDRCPEVYKLIPKDKIQELVTV